MSPKAILLSERNKKEKENFHDLHYTLLSEEVELLATETGAVVVRSGGAGQEAAGQRCHTIQRTMDSDV